MPNFYTPDSAFQLTTYLAAAVANAGTITGLAYPTGSSQASFSSGLVTNGYVIVNDNDQWTVVASKVAFTFGASTITITNNSGVTWPAGAKVVAYFNQVDGNDAVVIQVPVTLSALGNADIVTAMAPGIAGTIENIEFVTGVPVTTAAKLANVTCKINTTATTGGIVALTSAACTPLGKVVSGSAITGNNTITKNDTLTLTASGVTAFVEGTGFFNVRIRKS